MYMQKSVVVYKEVAHDTIAGSSLCPRDTLELARVVGFAEREYVVLIYRFGGHFMRPLDLSRDRLTVVTSLRVFQMENARCIKKELISDIQWCTHASGGPLHWDSVAATMIDAVPYIVNFDIYYGQSADLFVKTINEMLVAQGRVKPQPDPLHPWTSQQRMELLQVRQIPSKSGQP